MNSDSIGFFALIAIFLTVVKMLTKPNERLDFKKFEIWLVAYFMLVIVPVILGIINAIDTIPSTTAKIYLFFLINNIYISFFRNNYK